MPTLPRWLSSLVFALCLAGYGVFGLAPAWDAVHSAKHGRDYATYHYAVQVAADGGDPYDTQAMGALARAEKTRRSVHPYFYPPPFLLGMTWAMPLSLEQGYRAWFWLNQLFLVGILVVFRRWFQAPLALLGAIVLTFSPLPDNCKMGQANLPVLLASLWGLWRTQGVAVGVAGMAKMSPALYLPVWLVRRQWLPFALAAATAVVLSLMALPLVGLDAQLRFYTEVLPGFASGHYHGLTVPITLPANHSIPDLLNQLVPGPDKHTLAPMAQRISSLSTLGMLAGVCWLGRHRRDALGDAALFGLLTVLLLVTPVYTYEHHLVLALLPAAACFTAVVQGRLGRAWWLPLVLSYGLVAWPLRWLRKVQVWLGGTGDGHTWATWLVQESKFIGLVGLAVVAIAVVRASPRADSR